MAETSPQNSAQPTRLDGMTPIEVVAELQHLPSLVFFDTSGNLPSSATRPVSIIAARPSQILRGSILNKADRATLQLALTAAPSLPGDSGFPLGGLCGWIDYEGDFVFGNFPEMLVFCHSENIWWETGKLSECLCKTPEIPATISPFKPAMTHDDFLGKVLRIKEWIVAGDIYQANLSQRFNATVNGGTLFGLYQALRDASAAPMASWLALDGKEVLCSSPETFLKISGSHIETHPIKGTRPRFPNPDDDRRSAYELQTSSKEIAELVMITDLLRNDLGRVCEFGSVEVTEMLQLETLAQVHHLVSTVTGTLEPEIDSITALAACFPGGSITGAPKVRAQEIIHTLEDSPRGIYCGAIGWIGYNEQSSFNIAIRTLVRDSDSLCYQVGAGIVADSDPQTEYEETLHKAAGIRQAIAAFNNRR